MKLSVLILLLGVAYVLAEEAAAPTDAAFPWPWPRCYDKCLHPPCPLTKCEKAVATLGHLEDIQNGACMMEGVIKHKYVAGISGYFQAKKCGNCFQLTGPKASKTVVITDLSCRYPSPFCYENYFKPHFVLSPEVFTELTGKTDGTTEVSFREVICPCNLLESNFNAKLHIQKGSTPYWVAFVPYNTKASVERFFVYSKGVYTELYRDPVNGRFVFNGVTPASFPFTVWMLSAFPNNYDWVKCYVKDLSSSEIVCENNFDPKPFTYGYDAKLPYCPIYDYLSAADAAVDVGAAAPETAAAAPTAAGADVPPTL